MLKKIFASCSLLFLIVIISICNTYAKDDFSLSDGKYNSYYRNQLSDEAKLIYDGLCDNISMTIEKDGKFKIEVDLSNFNVAPEEASTIFQSALDAFDRDHPEVYWIDINKIKFQYYISKKKVNITYNSEYNNYLIDSYSTADDIKKDYKAIVSFLENEIPYINSYSGENETYDKIKYIHDLLIRINDYNSDITSASPKSLKCVSAIPGNISGKDAPVCEGYARAFKVICDKVGIGCVIVSGKGVTGTNLTPHMWNYVLIDENWYAIDITWDDPILTSGSYDELPEEKKYQYFLRGSQDFLSTHYEENIFVQKDNYGFEFGYPIIEYEKYSIDEKKYKIIINEIDGGKVLLNVKNPENISPGTVIKLSIIPDKGKQFDYGSLSINNKTYFATSFVMPSKDVIISLSFSDIKEETSISTKKPVTEKPSDNIQNESTDEQSEPTNKPTAKPTKPTNIDADNNNSDNQSSDNNSNNQGITDNIGEVNESDNQIPVIDINKEDNYINDDDLVNTINDANKNNKVSCNIINFSKLHLNKSEIKVGYRNETFDKDIIATIYNSIYDDDEINQMILGSVYNLNYYESVDTFTIKVTSAENGTIATLENDGTISFLIPLDATAYNSNLGIHFFVIEDSILVNYDCKIITQNTNNYIFFKMTKPVNTFMIVYNGSENAVTAELSVFNSPSTDNDISPVEANIKSTTGPSDYIYYLIIVAIVVMVIIIVMVFIFYFYMHYLNKIS